MVVAFLASSGGGGGSSHSPTVTGLEVDAPETPDRICVEFTIERGEGPYSAKVEFVRVSENNFPPTAATQLSGFTAPCQATPKRIVFVWDAKSDLNDEAAIVQIIVTPMGKTATGEPFRSQSFRAGNTPLQVRSGSLVTSDKNPLRISFDLIDQQSDRVQVKDSLLKVELSLSGGNFQSLPLGLVLRDRQEFLSAPDEGAQGSFAFDVGELPRRPDVSDELKQLGQKGFLGDIVVRLSVRDFETETFSVARSTRTVFNYNVKPFVEILPFQPGDLDSGIIPIRYRVFDPDKNPVNLQMSLDFQDGGGFQPANEFPAPPSDGISDLCKNSASQDCILDPKVFGNAGNPFHVFLWDALSQPFSGERVQVSLRADDKEEGTPTSQVLTGFQLTPFVHRKDIFAGDSLAARVIGDFNGDGASDLVVTDRSGGKVDYLRGGVDGLSQVRILEIPVGQSPIALVAGDFDGDQVLDLAVANSDSMSVSFLGGRKGAEEGLSADRKQDIAVGLSPTALATGDFDRDGSLDLVVANLVSMTVAYLRGTNPGGLERQEPDIDVGAKPEALVTGDFDGDGAPDVVVDKAGSEKLTYLRGGPDGLSGKRAREIDVKVPPEAFATGDFDGDGIPDLMVLGAESKTVRYLRGGTFDTPVEKIEMDSPPAALAAGDFNGDGSLDLVLGSGDSNNVSFFAGGSGGIPTTPKSEIEAAGVPKAFLAADFNEDGIQDLVVANGSSTTVSFLAGSPDGLSQGRRRDIDTGDVPKALAAGDFEGDGTLDLVVIKTFPSVVSYFRGDTGGVFEDRKRSIPIGNSPAAMVTVDFGGDRSLDLVVVNGSSENVTTLRGGPGGLSAARKGPTIKVGDFPQAVATGDFNGDKFPDVVVANSGEGTLSYLAGGAQGLPSKPTRNLDVGEFPIAFSVEDFDGNGIADVAVANGNGNTLNYLAGGDGGLTRDRNLSIVVGFDPVALQAGDFDGDGSLDLVAANSGSDENPSTTVTYLLGGRDGLSDLESRKRPLGAGNFPIALAAGDFDGDGALDLVVANFGSSTVSYFRGKRVAGQGLLEEARVQPDIPVGDSPLVLSAGDFDGDGELDLVVANSGSGTVTYLAGSEAGLSPSRQPDLVAGQFPRAMVARDFDGDGGLDLVVANQFSNTVSYFRRSTTGVAVARNRVVNVGDGPITLSAGDFDGNGTIDLAVANTNAGTIDYFPSRYLTAHVNCLEGAAPERCSLIDPRAPARYELRVGEGATLSPGQAVLVPSSVFPIPQESIFSQGKFLTAVTEAVTLLPEDNKVVGQVFLILRVKDLEPDVQMDLETHRERLRAFRRDRNTDRGIDAGVTPELLGIEGERAFQVKLPIERFGSYLVALERER